MQTITGNKAAQGWDVPDAAADQCRPKPIRVYPTREQRRAWLWATRQLGHGGSVFKMLEQAGDAATRAAVADAIARGRTVPPDIAQTVASFQDAKNQNP